MACLSVIYRRFAEFVIVTLSVVPGFLILSHRCAGIGSTSHALRAASFLLSLPADFRFTALDPALPAFIGEWRQRLLKARKRVIRSKRRCRFGLSAIVRSVVVFACPCTILVVCRCEPSVLQFCAVSVQHWRKPLCACCFVVPQLVRFVRNFLLCVCVGLSFCDASLSPRAGCRFRLLLCVASRDACRASCSIVFVSCVFMFSLTLSLVFCAGSRLRHFTEVATMARRVRSVSVCL